MKEAKILVGRVQTPENLSLEDIAKFIQEDMSSEIPAEAEMLPLDDMGEQFEGKKARIGQDFVDSAEYPRKFEVALVITEIT